MMEGLGFKQLLEMVQAFGVPGIVFILWYFSTRANEQTLKAYREDMMLIQGKHSQEIKEIRSMYENNVKLVQDYCNLSSDLRSVVTLNTQCWQKVQDDILRNQFCPNVRLKKDSPGRVNE